MNDREFKEAIRNFDILSRISGQKTSCIIKGQQAYRFKICPCCGGKKSHFVVFPESNTYSSFTQCCRGGDAFNYLINVEKLSSSDAYKVIYDSTNGSGSKEYKKFSIDEEKKDLKHLQTFFIEIVQEFKSCEKEYLKEIDSIKKNRLRLKKDFFEKYIDIFISSDYYNDYAKLNEISINFFALFSKEVIKEIERIEKYL